MSARFVDFFTAVATTSYVCRALRPAIASVIFIRHGWLELAANMEVIEDLDVLGVDRPGDLEVVEHLHELEGAP